MSFVFFLMLMLAHLQGIVGNENFNSSSTEEIEMIPFPDDLLKMWTKWLPMKVSSRLKLAVDIHHVFLSNYIEFYYKRALGNIESIPLFNVEDVTSGNDTLTVETELKQRFQRAKLIDEYVLNTTIFDKDVMDMVAVYSASLDRPVCLEHFLVECRAKRAQMVEIRYSDDRDDSVQQCRARWKYHISPQCLKLFIGPITSYTDTDLKTFRDFLMQYNNVTEQCFGSCVTDMTSRSVSEKEEKCSVNCLDKYLKMTQRVSMRFQEHRMITHEAPGAALPRQ